jgi:hypothetical protein
VRNGLHPEQAYISHIIKQHIHEGIDPLVSSSFRKPFCGLECPLEGNSFGNISLVWTLIGSGEGLGVDPLSGALWSVRQVLLRVSPLRWKGIVPGFRAQRERQVLIPPREGRGGRPGRGGVRRGTFCAQLGKFSVWGLARLSLSHLLTVIYDLRSHLEKRKIYFGPKQQKTFHRWCLRILHSLFCSKFQDQRKWIKLDINLIVVDDGVRWNILDNTITGNTWLRLKKNLIRITFTSLTIKTSSG